VEENVKQKVSLSKGQKILLIVSLVVVLLLGGIGGYMFWQQTQDRYEGIAETLWCVGILHDKENREEMLAGEGYWGDKYPKVKDKKGFHKKLAETLQYLIDNPGDVLTIGTKQKDVIAEGLAVLEQQGIHSEEVRDVFHAYVQQEKEEALQADKGMAAVTGMQALDHMLQDSQAPYYTDGLMTREEIADVYTREIEKTMEAKEYDLFSEEIGIIMEEGYMEDCFPDVTVLLDRLKEDCQIYTVASGKGGFYDKIEDTSSSSTSSLGASGMSSIGYSSSSRSTNSLGDFRVARSSSSTHVDGLLDQASKDKYNTSSSSTTLYFRDQDVNGRFYSESLEWAQKNGAQYIFCASNGSGDSEDKVEMDAALLIGRNKLYAVGKQVKNGNDYDMECYTYDGDFSQELKEVEELYQTKYSPEMEKAQALEWMKAGEYEKASQVFARYTNTEEGMAYVYQCALEMLRQGEYDAGLKLLGEMDAYKDLFQATEEKIRERIEDDFAGSPSARLFCRVMVDAVPALTDAEITQQLSGKTFTHMHKKCSVTFGTDGIYKENKASGLERQWSVQDGKLILKKTEGTDSTGYSVHPLFEEYYILCYDRPNRKEDEIILLKK
jgi:hypothetical protein